MERSRPFGVGLVLPAAMRPSTSSPRGDGACSSPRRRDRERHRGLERIHLSSTIAPSLLSCLDPQCGVQQVDIAHLSKIWSGTARISGATAVSSGFHKPVQASVDRILFGRVEIAHVAGLTPFRQWWLAFTEPLRTNDTVPAHERCARNDIRHFLARASPNHQNFVGTLTLGFQLLDPRSKISRNHCEVILSSRSSLSANSAVSNAFT